MKYLPLLLLFTISLFAEHIDKYITKMAITDDGKAKVVEIIDYNFGDIQKHGIYRDIPKNDTLIKNVKVLKNGYSENFTLFTQDRFWRLKIGRKDSYVTGKVEYKISYNLEGRIVKDKGDKNYIIFDIIGTAWQKPIRYAKGIIYLPKKLQNRVEAKAYRGYFGSSSTVPVKNFGSYLEVETSNLEPREGLTISIGFEPSLMKVSPKPSFKYYEKPIYYLFLAPILGLFFFFGKRLNIFGDIGSIAPKYRPSENLTIMEAGLLKDNFVDFKEIKPAILELANMGYIKINDTQDGTYLIKQKEPDSSLTQTQIQILQEIFSDGDEVSNSQLRIDTNLFNKIKHNLHNELVEKGYYSSSVKSARDSFLFAAVGIGLLTLAAFFYYISQDTGLEIIFPTVVAVGFIVIGIFNLFGALKSRDFNSIFFFVIWILFSSLFLFGSLNKDITISLLLMVIVIAIGSFLIYKRANTLTFKGVLEKRHLLGLREFIDKADKDKIKFFLQEDKGYLNKMLPYAVLFGLNKHWLELYQDLEEPLPQWYDGGYDSFNHLNIEPSHYSPDATGGFSDGIGSAPTIDTGDFGGFGDFSGGGFGGGGGDSW